MAVTPIGARCRRCGRDFHLFELANLRSGTCPRRATSGRDPQPGTAATGS